MANYILPSVLCLSVGKDSFGVVVANGTGYVYVMKEIPRELTGSRKEIEAYLEVKKISPKMMLEEIEGEGDDEKRIVGTRPLPGVMVSAKLLDAAFKVFNKYSVVTLREGNFISDTQAQLILARNLKKGKPELSIEDCKAEAALQFEHMQAQEALTALATLGFKPSSRLSKALLDKAKETIQPTPKVDDESDEESAE